jgi:hypothetical protein
MAIVVGDEEEALVAPGLLRLVVLRADLGGQRLYPGRRVPVADHLCC